MRTQEVWLAAKKCANSDRTWLIVVHENMVKSWARDAVTFGCFCGVTLALNTLMAPSGFINFAIAVSFLLWVFGKQAFERVQVDSLAEARRFLESVEEAQVNKETEQ